MIFIFYYHILYVRTCGIWKLPGQGVNHRFICKLHNSCCNAGFFNPMCQARDRARVPVLQRHHCWSHHATAGTPGRGFLNIRLCCNALCANEKASAGIHRKTTHLMRTIKEASGNTPYLIVIPRMSKGMPARKKVGEDARSQGRRTGVWEAWDIRADSARNFIEKH